MIEISLKDSKLNISGNSSIVGSIRGEGMLENVLIPPVISKDDIIKKCDQWLDIFKKVHDEFKKLVLKNKYRNQNITMELVLSSYHSTVSNDEGNYISLSLEQYSHQINKGVSIYIDDKNSDLYKYLAASVLDYYLSQNLEGREFDFMDFNGTLYSIYSHEGSTVPMMANTTSLMQEAEYAQMISCMLGNHNVGESSEQLLSDLKNNIRNQQLSEEFEHGIEDSTRQSKFILKKTPNSKK